MPKISGLAVLGLLAAASAVAAEPEAALRAQLKPKRSVTLAAGISGELSRLPFREGDRVEAGSAIAAVDCTPQHASRRVGEAKLQGARAKLRVTERLAELNQSSVLEVEVARAEAAVAAAELAAVEALVRKCEVRAPYAGIVAAVPAHQHQYVREGEPLVEIVDTDNPEVEMVLPSRWLEWLKPGMPFTFHSDDLGRAVPAKVDRIGGRVDPVSQTVRVLGRLDAKAADLLPGMSGGVRFERSGR